MDEYRWIDVLWGEAWWERIILDEMGNGRGKGEEVEEEEKEKDGQHKHTQPGERHWDTI